MMRWQVVAMLCGCLLGCSTARQYRIAADELHHQHPHLWCWASAEGEVARCDRTGASSLAESACVRTLAASTVERPSLDTAMGEVESCMKSQGWFRYPIAAAPKFERMPQCTDDRPADQCPATLDQTAR